MTMVRSMRARLLRARREVSRRGEQPTFSQRMFMPAARARVLLCALRCMTGAPRTACRLPLSLLVRCMVFMTEVVQVVLAVGIVERVYVSLCSLALASKVEAALACSCFVMVENRGRRLGGTQVSCLRGASGAPWMHDAWL